MEAYRAHDRHLIEVRGPDRIQWLHNLCTNDILLLATGRRGDTVRKGERIRVEKTPAGRGCYAVLANRQGKMVAEFKVLLFTDFLLLETGEPTLLNTLSKHIIMEDVELKERQAPVHHLLGATLEDLELPGPIPLFHFAYLVEHDALFSPTPFGIDVIGGFPKLNTSLSEMDYETQRIEAGWPRWGVDIDTTVLPMEAGLEPIAISYSKGCYLGQEVIQRLKTYSETPRHLVSLATENASRGDAIVHHGQEVGHATSATRGHALGLVHKEAKTPGTTVLVGDRPATVEPLRWHATL